MDRSPKGEPLYDNEFIRTLTTAVAESTITGNNLRIIFFVYTMLKLAFLLMVAFNYFPYRIFLGIGNQETPNNLTLETEAMQHRAVILKKYLDAKVERETQALFALQALVHKLEHPNSKS